ncbi:MAG: PulJ/GspJ family protein [Planctomycetota bacterium]
MPRRRAFSLAEVVVAIGILALMMTLAGEVMKLTVEATGRAQALTEVNQALRIFEQSLRDDLAAIDREKSVILIHGNPVNAYWTQAHRDADDDDDPGEYPHAPDPEREDPYADRLQRPRADILMFFTSRKEVTNYVRYRYEDGNIPREMRQAVSSYHQQVVYGHAELGEYVGTPYIFEPDLTVNPGETMFPQFPDPDSDAVAPVPAEQWHLARRSVLLTSSDAPETVSGTAAWADWDSGFGAKTPDGEWLLNSADIVEGETDVIARFDYYEVLSTPSTTPGPPYDTCSLPKIFRVAQNLTPGELPVGRSRLDLTPPPLLAGRLGHYFVSNCASFKVEWTLDPSSDFVGGRLDGEKQILWFDPGWVNPVNPTARPSVPGEGPLGALTAAIDSEPELPSTDRRLRLDSLYKDELGEDRHARYRLKDRFGGTQTFWNSCGYGDGERGNMAFFAAMGDDPSAGVAEEDIFPVALRVTVDLYDKEHRLERPIRHVIIARVGG